MQSRGQKHSKTVMLANSGSGRNTATLTLVVPMGRVFGNKMGYHADDKTKAAVTADPATIIYGYVWVGSNDGSIHPTVDCKITVTQYVTLMGRRFLTV